MNVIAKRGKKAKSTDSIKGEESPLSEPLSQAKKQIKVLVVDDDAVGLLLIKMVEFFDHECERVKDGYQALECYKKGGIDLVLTDLTILICMVVI